MFYRSALQYAGKIPKETASISAHKIPGSGHYLQFFYSTYVKFLMNSCVEAKLGRQKGRIVEHIRNTFALKEKKKSPNTVR